MWSVFLNLHVLWVFAACVLSNRWRCFLNLLLLFLFACVFWSWSELSSLGHRTLRGIRYGSDMATEADAVVNACLFQPLHACFWSGSPCCLWKYTRLCLLWINISTIHQTSPKSIAMTRFPLRCRGTWATALQAPPTPENFFKLPDKLFLSNFVFYSC